MSGGNCYFCGEPASHSIWFPDDGQYLLLCGSIECIDKYTKQFKLNPEATKILVIKNSKLQWSTEETK